MAIEQAYVAVSEDYKLGTVYHTQVDCAWTRKDNLQIAVISDEEGELRARWRTLSNQVRPCTHCGPELEWDWQKEGNCYGQNINMIDPPYQEIGHNLLYCEGCPVRLECGEFALSRDMTGIWGGVFLPLRGKAAKRAYATLERECAILRAGEVA